MPKRSHSKQKHIKLFKNFIGIWLTLYFLGKKWYIIVITKTIIPNIIKAKHLLELKSAMWQNQSLVWHFSVYRTSLHRLCLWPAFCWRLPEVWISTRALTWTARHAPCSTTASLGSAACPWQTARVHSSATSAVSRSRLQSVTYCSHILYFIKELMHVHVQVYQIGLCPRSQEHWF